MKAIQLSLIFAGLVSACAAGATLVYLPDNVVEVNTADKPFSNTINGIGFWTSGAGAETTIVSGVTTLANALTYEARSHNNTAGYNGAETLPGRFNNANVSGAKVQYNFTTARDLGGFLLWNYALIFNGTPENQRGVVNATITVTYDGGSTAVFNPTFSLMPNQDYNTYSTDVSFGGTLQNVTQVEFSGMSNGGQAFLGWDEFVAYGAIPEPSVILLGGLGGLLLLRRRRR